MSKKPDAIADAGAPAAAQDCKARKRRRLRVLLLVVLPIVALASIGWLYLAGGRYVTTDNAYVSAQKVLITPDVSGRIVAANVVEGAKVHPGDLLFSIDPSNYEAAVKQAEAQLAQARSDYMNLRATVQSLAGEKTLAQQVIDARSTQLTKRKGLVAKGVTAADAMNDWRVTVASAKAELAGLEKTEAEALAKLLGNRDLPLESFPAYMLAGAQLEKAQSDLDKTKIRAPIEGIATQVPNIQIGRYIAAGTPVFAVVAEAEPWVDANLKETDLTHVALGQDVTITVDTFPDRVWHGRVQSISPGTGAQFSVLPAQNASGNWVKVVQRVPVRIAFASSESTQALRAGLSVYVSIDTKHQRTLAGLFGHSATAETATAAETAAN